MARRNLRKLLAKAKRSPGKLIYMEVRGGPVRDFATLKLFAEKTGYGRGIVIYAVSPDFKKRRLAERNELVWELLDRELPERELELISHLFTFTPKEFRSSARKAVAVH